MPYSAPLAAPLPSNHPGAVPAPSAPAGQSRVPPPDRTPLRALYRAGLLLLCLSGLLFLVPELANGAATDGFGLFILHHAITVCYFIAVLGTGALRRGRGGLHPLLTTLLLGLIGAYALNREIPVFERSTPWLSALLVVSTAATLLLPHLHRLARPVRLGVAGALGVALTLWTYLALYLTPLYALSVVASPFFGLSLHTYVPVLLLIFSLKWAVRAARADRSVGRAVGIGFGLAVAATVVFVVQWAALDRTARRTLEASESSASDLPGWVHLASRMPRTWATGRYLKAGLSYTVPKAGFSAWDLPSRSFEDVRRHDPLVMTAAALCGTTSLLREDDRIHLLEAVYDARHQAEDRLWSGEHLSTGAVATAVELWPAQRLSYTEKVVTVHNNGDPGRWGAQEEAIYTFHLPEGGAVTSLSLWIDGVEQKGILTTRGKADNAYRSIVGVEQRDPSLVHWEEGNTVSVRVFPVVAGSSRKFKIGVTAPLAAEEGRLRYDPVYFEGPSAAGARETVDLHIPGAAAPLFGLEGLTEKEGDHYTGSRSLTRAASVILRDPGLRPASFTFGGATYTLEGYTPRRTAVRTDAVYLDLNAAWTRTEFEAVLAAAGTRPAYAFTNRMVRITKDNRAEMFATGTGARFSMFPLYAVPAPEGAVIVTKGVRHSPAVNDLEGSLFAMKTDAFLKQAPPVRLFNLGSELSPFLRTLQEHRVFHYEHGSAAKLSGLLERGVFAGPAEDSATAVVHAAGIRIRKTAASTSTGAAAGPDHLMRLYAYNHLMARLQGGLYAGRDAEEALVEEAAQAHVVTPVSSLVVLETAADYKRFGIEQAGGSLRNAAVRSRGAVPEPHEWALIIAATGLLIWTRFKDQLRPILIRRAR